jgi:hypothetical protein
MKPSRKQPSRQRSILIPLWVVMLVFLADSPFSLAQPADSLKSKIESAVDRALQDQKQDLQLRLDRIKASEGRAFPALRVFSDSLIAVKSDSLSPESADSIRREVREYLDELRGLMTEQHSDFAGYYPDFDTLLLDLKNDEYEDFEEFELILDATRAEIAGMVHEIDSMMNAMLNESMAGAREFTRMSVDGYIQERQADGTSGTAVEEEAEAEEESTFTVSLGFSNQFSYRGRTSDSVKNASLTPSAMYVHPSGFYASASLYWLSNAEPRLSEFDLGVGYMWDISDRFNLTIGYTRLFYKKSSELYSRKITGKILGNTVERDVVFTLLDNPQNKVGLDLGYEIPSIVDLALSSEFTFGGGYDFDCSFGLSHDFIFEEALFSNDLSFTPSAGVYFGFTYNYKKGSVKKTGENSYDVAVVKKVAGIAIYDYQITLPLSYSIGNFSIGPAFSVNIPANAISSTRGKSQVSESSSSFSLDLSYKF